MKFMDTTLSKCYEIITNFIDFFLGRSKKESIFAPQYRESSSVGRASAFQAECRRFEPGLSLKKSLIK